MFVPLIKFCRNGFAMIILVVLAGCTAVPDGAEFSDPYEQANRKVHSFNTGVDRVLLRPSSQAYGTVIPQPVKQGVTNFASNLNQPGYVVNDVLQGNVEDASHNFFRFLVNTVFGFGGLLNPADSFGLEERSSDFGETLHVWGAEEGNYLELPLLGPSTGRDAVGTVVDIAMNPLNFVLPSEQAAAAAIATGASVVGDRYQYSDFIDSILYESADSYAQARLQYLQNRRFTLADGSVEEEDYFDPFEDEDFLQ